MDWMRWFVWVDAPLTRRVMKQGGLVLKALLACLLAPFAALAQYPQMDFPLHVGDRWEFVEAPQFYHEAQVLTDTTVINGLKYTFVTGTLLQGYYRKDGPRIYQYMYGTDRLICDFTKKPGDTLGVYPNGTDSVRVLVSSQGLSQIFGVARFRMGFMQVSAKNPGMIRSTLRVVDSIGFVDISEETIFLTLNSAVIHGRQFGPNRAPVFHPSSDFEVPAGKPFTFRVSAYDPEGEAVTFTWRRDDVVAKYGPDSTFTVTFSGPYREPHKVVCVASDPEGLQDSVIFLFTLTSINDDRLFTPDHFSLDQNYPNPFNPSTAISYQLSAVSFVTLKIFDVLGREVASLVNEKKSAGRYTVEWYATGPSGIYFYRLEARPTDGGQAVGYVETKKMVVVK